MPKRESSGLKRLISVGGLGLLLCLYTPLAFATNYPPKVGTITPASGTSNANQEVTFTTTYSDPNGWQNIQFVYLLINTSTNGAKCFYGYYNQNTNKLYLRNDANSGWLGGYTPGSTNTIENSYAKLNCAQTTYSGSGTTLTVRWRVTFKSTFTGAKKSYLYVKDDSNRYNGWVQKGTWNIIQVNNPPQTGTISPINSFCPPNQTTNFTATYIDPDGWQNLQYCHLSFANELWAYYDQNANKIFLIDGSGGFAPGSGNVITIPNKGKIYCAQTTASGSGTTLTIKWAVSFDPAFSGTKNVYLAAIDDSFATTNLVYKGTWTIQAPNSSPQTGTISPINGSCFPNQTTTFTAIYIDPDGYANLQYCHLSFANELWAYYDQNANKIFLIDGSGGYAPGSNNTITIPNKGKIYCAQTSVSGSGTTLTIKWAVSFDSKFSGAKAVYLAAIDDSFATTNLVYKGTWTVNIAPQTGTVSPINGSCPPNQTINFTTTYIDPDGYANLQYCHLSFANELWAYYDQNANKIFLIDGSGGYAPGSGNTITIPNKGKIYCAQTSVSGSGTTLTIIWAVSFDPAFTGIKNVYLAAIDDAFATTHLVYKGTWAINHTLSIIVNPDLWNIGQTSVNSTVLMSPANKITVTNDGTGPETFAVSLVNPSGWSAATAPGTEIYCLSGIFCSTTDIPQNQNFNQDASIEDVILTASKTATPTVFAYAQGTANGVNVPSLSARALFLQFKSPTITNKTTEQQISVIITVQTP